MTLYQEMSLDHTRRMQSKLQNCSAWLPALVLAINVHEIRMNPPTVLVPQLAQFSSVCTSSGSTRAVLSASCHCTWPPPPPPYPLQQRSQSPKRVAGLESVGRTQWAALLVIRCPASTSRGPPAATRAGPDTVPAGGDGEGEGQCGWLTRCRINKMGAAVEATATS